MSAVIYYVYDCVFLHREVERRSHIAHLFNELRAALQIRQHRWPLTSKETIILTVSVAATYSPSDYI